MGKKNKDEDKKRTTKKQVVKAFKAAFEMADMEYEFDEDDSLFRTGFMGDDLPIGVGIYLDDLMIAFRCPLRLKAEEVNYQKVAWELNNINKTLFFGSFFLEPDGGYIMFKYGFPYIEADVSPEFLLDFIEFIVKTIDKYDGMLKGIAEKAPEKDYDRLYR